MEKINKCRKILAIDDERAIRTSFRNFLEDYGYEVEEASNGVQGLEKIESFKPHVVLVDLRMPAMDGLAVLDAVKEKEENLPVIVISGTGEISDVVLALRKGAWDYILKPVQDMNMVVLAIEKAWERAVLIDRNQQYQYELEKTVSERTEDLQMANEDLKAFDYSVSNALQAPLRIISGFCSILLEENIEQLDEKGAKYLDRIFDSVESCRTLVNELLKMSRVTRKELEKEQLNISKLVKAEYFKTLSKYNLNEVSLILAERMIVEADPYLLSFALNAIIDNSVKSMISNDKPSLKVSFEEKNDVTEFCIEDNGIGFSHDRARKIFEPFHSYHTDVDFTGSGLGLATAERIIRRHGGRIWAESEEGRGTKVFFTL